MALKLKYTILYVDDVAATLDFFVRAFGFERGMVHENAYGELATGETTLSFCSKTFLKELGKTAGKADYHVPVFEIAFETDDVASALATALAAGATLVQDKRDEPWGQTTAYVAEPNGFLIEICTPVRK
jgi:lactoylglutathione lyase